RRGAAHAGRRAAVPAHLRGRASGRPCVRSGVRIGAVEPSARGDRSWWQSGGLATYRGTAVAGRPLYQMGGPLTEVPDVDPDKVRDRRSRRRLPDPVRLPVVADHADHPRRPRGAAGRVHDARPVPAQARARPGTQASRKLTRALSRGPAAPPAAAGTGRSRRPAPNPLSARPGTGLVRSPPALGAGPGLVPDRSVPERAVLAPGVVDDHVRGPVEDLDRAGGRIEPPPAG